MGKAAQRKKTRKLQERQPSKRPKAQLKVRLRLLVGLCLITVGLLIAGYVGYPYANMYLGTEAKTDSVDEEVTFHLMIPSVKIDAPVYDGITQEILIKGIGHNKGSRFPGEKGTCILEGHNLNAFWPGGFENVKHPERYFATLHLVKPGAEVLVGYDGRSFKYNVVKVERVKSNDPSLRILANYEQLVLITCSPGVVTLDRFKVTCLPAKQNAK